MCCKICYSQPVKECFGLWPPTPAIRKYPARNTQTAVHRAQALKWMCLALNLQRHVPLLGVGGVS